MRPSKRGEGREKRCEKYERGLRSTLDIRAGGENQDNGGDTEGMGAYRDREQNPGME
jgi:hypothetical protein